MRYLHLPPPAPAKPLHDDLDWSDVYERLTEVRGPRRPDPYFGDYDQARSSEMYEIVGWRTITLEEYRRRNP